MTGAISSMAAGSSPLAGMASQLSNSSPILKMLTNVGSGDSVNPFAAASGQTGMPAEAPNSLPQLDALPQVDLTGKQAKAPQVATPAPMQGTYADMIAQSAKRWGVDPATAQMVAKSEGGLDGWIQSKFMKNGRQEPSFGPFQMLIGGGDTGFPEGMGNQIIRERGIDPRDPKNAEKVIDFAMEQASKKGWGQWYGAKAAGIGNMDGIGGRPAGVSPMTSEVMGGAPADGSAPVGGDSDPYRTIFGGMFKPPEKAGQGETAQKGFMEKAMGAVAGAGGRGGPQIASGGSEAAGGSQASDDAPQYLAQANERINTSRGANARGAERKAELRNKVRGGR